MSERVAVIKEKWVACAILWAVLVLLYAVSWWVDRAKDGVNPFEVVLHVAMFVVPIVAASSCFAGVRELRRRASLPRGFRVRRYWPGPRDVGWWVFVGPAVAWSLGAMLWVPDSSFITIGAVFLLVQLGAELGHIAFLSTRDERPDGPAPVHVQ